MQNAGSSTWMVVTVDRFHRASTLEQVTDNVETLGLVESPGRYLRGLREVASTGELSFLLDLDCTFRS